MLRQRLAARETGASLAWHQERAAELHDLMDKAALEDILVDAENASPHEIAQDILARIGWLPPWDSHGAVINNDFSR